MDGTGSKHMRCMEVWGGNRCTEAGVVLPGLDAWVYSQPCEHEAAGGDVHYVSTCAGGWVVRMLVADVAGHGAAVAEIASHLRALMRRHINDHDQVRFVRSLNREFTAASSGGVFATAVVMTFDATTNHLLVSSAGHPAPLWYRADRREWALLAPPDPREEPDRRCDAPLANVPWGIEDGVEYGQFEVCLGVGDVVLTYTDGLPEARDARGEMVGTAGVLDLVRGLGEPDPSRLVPRLLGAIGDGAGDNLARDDVTCLLFRPNGLRPYIPLRDRLLAPLRVVADRGGLHFGWSGSGEPAGAHANRT